MTVIVILSFILIMIAFYIFLFSKNSLIENLFFNIVFVISFSLHILYWIAHYFTGEGLNAAVIYHINYGLAGASFIEYWKVVLLTVLAFVILFILLFVLLSVNFKEKFSKKIKYIAFIVLILSIIINPATIDLYDVITEQNIEVDFNKYYKKPTINKINQSKNLVFIYAESLERTYFNQELFPGLIDGLRDLKSKSLYFTDIRQIPGTSWTIGGMVSSQLGIPLFTPINNMEIHEINQLLPSAKGVGDLLSNQGYFLSFYQGAELQFQGKDKFYSTHNFDEIKGLKTLLNQLEDKNNINSWGLYDDKLLDLVYQRFIQLSESKEKFALFTITIGTHHPNGHIPKDYRDIKYSDGQNPILNAVKVSDILISDFVKKILTSKYGNNTIIVIASDHLAMRNTAFNLLEDAERRNMFMIIEKDRIEEIQIDKIGSTLDIGPTILDFIGYEAEIGLGRDLIDPKTSSYEIKQIHKNLTAWKKEIKSFWQNKKD
ncbi:MAG: sulfatase-like hydrolase/transferase [Halanaerobiales bacterium]|nr:sulfatase-like hydrolase/transferase [Halanaerobiales bacterium]